MAIQLSDMMAGTLNCARNVATISSGEEVLIVADTTTDPEITEAYKIAYESEGGRVSVLTVKGVGAGCSSEQITHNTLYGLYPKMAVEAAKGADLCINLTGFADMHGIYGTGLQPLRPEADGFLGKVPHPYAQRHHFKQRRSGQRLGDLPAATVQIPQLQMPRTSGKRSRWRL